MAAASAWWIGDGHSDTLARLPPTCLCACGVGCVRALSVAPVPKRFTKATAAGTVQWFSPMTISDLVALQSQFATAPAGTVKYVCGNTIYGVVRNGPGCVDCLLCFVLWRIFVYLPDCVGHDVAMCVEQEKYFNGTGAPTPYMVR